MFVRFSRPLFAGLALAAALIAPVSAADDAAAAGTPAGAALQGYTPVSGVSGNLNSIGSDTLNNLMTFWAEGFLALYPNVNIQIEGKGSSTAPPALIEGTAQIGPMSRQMKSSEIDAFEKKYGYKPTEIRVAIDALAVFVHKDNPIKGMTMQDVDSIFSSTRKRGGKAIETWGQLGLTGEWANRPISLYGRNSASGTYGFYKEIALKGGDYRATVKEQPGSSSVVQGIASDLAGIGYSGIGYKTSGVRALPLGEKTEAIAEGSHENCLNGSYPLARFLYVYINKKPGAKPDPLIHEFVRYINAQQGQDLVVKDGYYPLTADIATETMDSLAK
ncbi:MAG: phosphate ABC transporter substrate-binding protein [Planctomycetes bacterium]|nr:phosphate ABC transporter substrate-binding protein [Planctomycetota bacterium]